MTDSHCRHNGRVWLEFPYLRIFCSAALLPIVFSKGGSWLVVYAANSNFSRVSDLRSMKLWHQLHSSHEPARADDYLGMRQ